MVVTSSGGGGAPRPRPPTPAPGPDRGLGAVGHEGPRRTRVPLDHRLLHLDLLQRDLPKQHQNKAIPCRDGAIPAPPKRVSPEPPCWFHLWTSNLSNKAGSLPFHTSSPLPCRVLPGTGHHLGPGRDRGADQAAVPRGMLPVPGQQTTLRHRFPKRRRFWM